jgi:hypothetical protein
VSLAPPPLLPSVFRPAEAKHWSSYFAQDAHVHDL